MVPCPSLRGPRPSRAPGARELLIEPCAPFRLDRMAWAPRRGPHNAVDHWCTSTDQRALSIDGSRPVALSLTPDVAIDSSRLSGLLGGGPIDKRVELAARGVLERLLGLSADRSPSRRWRSAIRCSDRSPRAL